MALVTCPECGHQLSDTASACPNCGYKMNTKDPAPSIVAPAISPTELGRFSKNRTAGIVLIVIGGLMLIVGLFTIGIIIGFFFIFAAAIMIGVGTTYFKGTRECVCPYCKSSGTIGRDDIRYDCPVCKKTSVRNGNYLNPVP